MLFVLFLAIGFMISVDHDSLKTRILWAFMLSKFVCYNCVRAKSGQGSVVYYKLLGGFLTPMFLDHIAWVVLKFELSVSWSSTV